jgi:hypothetical protein
LYEGKRLLAERRQQGALVSSERIDHHPAVFMLLNEIDSGGTADESEHPDRGDHA